MIDLCVLRKIHFAILRRRAGVHIVLMHLRYGTGRVRRMRGCARGVVRMRWPGEAGGGVGLLLAGGGRTVGGGGEQVMQPLH